MESVEIHSNAARGATANKARKRKTRVDNINSTEI
jgi:hypothetical protein